jgi:hypothetical protein
MAFDLNFLFLTIRCLYFRAINDINQAQIQKTRINYQSIFLFDNKAVEEIPTV